MTDDLVKRLRAIDKDIVVRRFDPEMSFDGMTAHKAADRIEKLEAENKKLKSGLWSIVGLCKWGVDRTPSFCGEEESCSCIKAFNALDYDLSNSFDD